MNTAYADTVRYAAQVAVQPLILAISEIANVEPYCLASLGSANAR
jgi:hypothetical protein